MESRKYQLQKQIIEALKANDNDLSVLLKSQWAHRFGVESLEELKSLDLTLVNKNTIIEDNHKNYVGYWDFNPISGCYLEKNIIESTEAFKLGTNITEIRNSGHTYKLLKDSTIENQTSTPEVCKKFLDIIPTYYFRNMDTLSYYCRSYCNGFIYFYKKSYTQ